MRRVLWVVAIVLLFSSCRTGRQVVVVEARDSVRVEERVREIKVSDTLFVAVPMQKESTTVRDSTSHLENDYAISDARVMADGSLYHSLETKPRTDTLSREVGVQVRDSIIYREKVVPKIVPVEKELNWFTQMRIWLGNVMLVLIAGAAAWTATRLLLKK
ncbi:MAG TPA: hypothetical protein DHU85_10345 [Porphyromonadaceae bacterium]|nr:hypothetical protein [Porphyromonadaceae bacterium]